MKTAIVIGLLLCACLAPGSAAAESCGADGRICVLADLSKPQIAGERLTVRVPSEATELTGTGVADPRLVSAGPAGGASLWEFECCPHAGTTVLRIWAREPAAGTLATAEFQLRVVDFTDPVRSTVRREGPWLTARWDFEPRVAATGLFSLQVYGPKPILINGKQEPALIPRKPAQRLVKAPAERLTRVVVRVPLRAISRVCAKQPYCKWTTQQTVRRTDNGSVLRGSLITRFGPRKAPAFFE